MKLIDILQEASPINLEDLTPAQQTQVKIFEKIFGANAERIFRGMGENSVAIKLSDDSVHRYKFTADVMKKLLAANALWLNHDLGNRVVIGF